MTRSFLFFISTFVSTYLVASSTSSMSFAPPPGDFSIAFLSSLFGIVDGVLHGSGSQIMGAMFGIFNSAVLSVGGIIIMYTLLVSTMNTAQDGEMLGKKWSSVWVPVRAALGLSLLIPKASGYCLMQIFVMWIVVQGVGAADQVWAAALGYLNQGGTIIQQNTPAFSNTNASSTVDTSAIATGATRILAGQVCMLALQNILQSKQQGYLNNAANNSGPCYPLTASALNGFCTTPVPNFLSSVNAIQAQQSQTTATTSYSVQMPNFPGTQVLGGPNYSLLNGICGEIVWSVLNTSSLEPFAATSGSQASTNFSLSATELANAQYARSAAVQQMYTDLSLVAQNMVWNLPFLSPVQPSAPNYSSVAIQQFGVPYTISGTACNNSPSGCQLWGPDTSMPSGSSLSLLFTGLEFQNAIADYNTVIMPTLGLLNQITSKAINNNAGQFISAANNKGWLMAGSYYFNLMQLNAQAIAAQENVGGDGGSGLKQSNVFSPASLQKPCASNPSTLCSWLSNDQSGINFMVGLINGSSAQTAPATPAIPEPIAPIPGGNTKLTGYGAGPVTSTVYGFVSNSYVLQSPGQPGAAPSNFQSIAIPSLQMKPSLSIPTASGCAGRIHIWPIPAFCLGNPFLDSITAITSGIIGLLMALVKPAVDFFMNLAMIGPLNQLKTIFENALSIMNGSNAYNVSGNLFSGNLSVSAQNLTNVNPILALANMGVMYINYASNYWIKILFYSVTTAIIPVVGGWVFAFLTFALPLIVAWLSIMMGIGFITAYYIPFLPYMIFTFASIAWLMAVIEAMVAAPIVALGITHPEGEGPFGKGEKAVLILLNVFLRPSMMIIGYIAGIILSYVGVWVINAGFTTILPNYTQMLSYSSWAGIYQFFFVVLIYTMTYMTIVDQSFTLITHLPDAVLRWIGGEKERYGTDAASWTRDIKDKVTASTKPTTEAQGQMAGKQGGAVMGSIPESKTSSLTGS